MKSVCSAEVSQLLPCSFKTLFRGSIKWQFGKNTSLLNDVDFEVDEFYLTHDGSLIIPEVNEERRFFQCVGIGFDDGEEKVLKRYQILKIGERFKWILNAN